MRENRNLSGFAIAILFLSFLSIGTAQENPARLRVHILDFTIVDSLSYPKTILKIDSGLEASFRNYDKIRVLPAESPGASLLDSLQKDSLRKGEILSVREDVDMIVFGWYVVENRYVKIQPVAYDVANQRFYSLSLSRGTINAIDGLISRVTDNLESIFIEISPIMRQSYKKVAILSNFKQLQGSSRKIVGQINSLSDDYTKQIIEQLDYDGIDYAEIISWRQILKYRQEPVQFNDSLNPDMILTLTFIFDSLSPISLRADFLLYENNNTRPRKFTLPELKADHYGSNKIAFSEFVESELTQFLNRIVDENGRWDWKSFSNLKSAGSKDVTLIKRAEDLAAKNDFYLSNHCYYTALNNDDESTDRADIHLKLGLNKVYLYRLAEANKEFELVLKTNPDNGYAYVGKSLIKYFSADYDNAQTSYEEAKNLLVKAKENGLDNEFVFEALMGYYDFEMEDFDAALSHFTDASKLSRSSVKIRIGEKLSIETLKIYIGLCYIGLEEYDKAIGFYQSLKQEFPFNSDIPYYLGTAFSNRGIDKFFKKDYREAISDFESSSDNYSDADVNDYVRLSMIYLGNFDRADIFIQQEIDRANYDPSFIWKKHARDLWKIMIAAAASSESETYSKIIGGEVIKSLNRSIESYENDPIALYRLGEIYTLLGDNEKGLEYILKASETDPLDFEIRLGLMQAYLLTNNYKQCGKLFREFTSRKNREYVDERTTILAGFFYTSSLMANEKKAKKELKKIADELDSEVVITHWILKPYQFWLKKCNCTDEAREALTSLLSKIITKTGS